MMSKFRHFIFNLIRSLFWAAMWLTALGFMLWIPLRQWPGDDFRPVQFLNYFMPWLLLGLIPAFAAATLARRQWLASTLALPAAFIIFSYAPLFLPRTGLARAESTALTVMSYNVWRNNRDFPATAQAILGQLPDLLLLQEIDSADFEALQNELRHRYPDRVFHLAYERRMKQAIISRYPLTPQTASRSQGRAQKVIVHAPGQEVMVVNVHFSQPYYWQEHYGEMVRLVNDVKSVELPVIVGGDFNTTDQSEVYQMMNRLLANAHWEAGWGFGFSFPADQRSFRGVTPPTPLIRIDHIFYSDHFIATAAGTLSDSGGSDHFPIMAELELVD